MSWIYLLLLIFSLSFSEEKKYTLEELCKYDDKFCRFAFDETGKTYTPNPGVRFIVANLHEEFVAAGEKYGVDPRVIAGSFLAENTLNVQLSDDIQNFIAKHGVTGIGDKTFSYGLGQIKMDTAMVGEQTIAKIENRPPRSFSEIEVAILNPKEAIRLGAGVIRNAQDVYKEKGFDISKQPEIASTLYNLGNPEERVRSASASSPPRTNYFGAFVVNNMQEIEDTIGWSPEKGKYKPVYLNSTNYGNNVMLTSKPMPLFSHPPTCTSGQERTRIGEMNKNKTYNGYRKTGEVRNAFQIIDQDIDCEMQRWVLLQTTDGNTGWIKQYELEQNSKTATGREPKALDNIKNIFKQICTDSTNSCQKKIGEITGTKNMLKEGVLDVVVNAPEGVEQPSIEKFYSECYDNQIGGNRGFRIGGGYRNSLSQKLTKPLINKSLKQIEERKQELEKKYKKQWADFPKDFRKLFETADALLRAAMPRSNTQGVEVKVAQDMKPIEGLLALEPDLSPPSSTKAPVANTNGPQYFGDMNGYTPTNNNTSSYGNRMNIQSPGGNPKYAKVMEDLQYNFIYDYRYTDWRDVHAASAPNITEKEQPIGPASAPRGKQADKITQQVKELRETRGIIKEIAQDCKEFPENGFALKDMLPLLDAQRKEATAMAGNNGYIRSSRFSNYLRDNSSVIVQSCKLFSDIMNDRDLGRNKYCDRLSESCKMYLLDANGKLYKRYIPFDYIKKYKNLLKPNEIVSSIGEQIRKNIFDSLGIGHNLR